MMKAVEKYLFGMVNCPYKNIPEPYSVLNQFTEDSCLLICSEKNFCSFFACSRSACIEPRKDAFGWGLGFTLLHNTANPDQSWLTSYSLRYIESLVSVV